MEKHKHATEGLGLRIKPRSSLLLSDNASNHVVVRDVCRLLRRTCAVTQFVPPLVYRFYECATNMLLFIVIVVVIVKHPQRVYTTTVC